MNKVRQILRQRLLGESLKGISRNTCLALRTVKKYVRAAEASDKSLNELVELDDPALSGQLFPPEPAARDSRLAGLEGRFAELELALRRVGMTRKLLWYRYKEEDPAGYNYSQFCRYLRAWQSRQNAVMHFDHKGGDKLFVDFTGKKLRVIDRESGRMRELEVFVATLGASGYTYVEAVESQQKADFIGAAQNALRFFGGVPRAIIPDNLKSAVQKSNRYEPSLNAVFEDFCEHYGMAAIPARAYKPRDKGLVENAVRLVYQRIYARLPEQPYSSTEALNTAIRTLLEKHNRCKFQGGEWSCSRRFLRPNSTPNKPTSPVRVFWGWATNMARTG